MSYVIRIEDIESGLHWSISKRFNEFFTFYEELRDMCPYVREIDFPKKRIAMKNSPKLVEMRIVGLELYLRKSLHTLTLYASMDNSASRALRHLQQFLGVDRKIDCIHPPLMDDQRAIEIMAYQFLNDYNSPACQQCVKFISSVDLESVVEPGEDGYKALLTFLHDALAEVEQFVQEQHEQQLEFVLKSRRPDWTEEQRLKLVRLCIRRQVESALYLPMRRNVFGIVQNFVSDKSRKLHRAISLLQQAKPSVFMVDYEISRAGSLPKAIKALRASILSYLPVDQGQFLVESAKIIAELHTECREIKIQASSSKSSGHQLEGGKPPLIKQPSTSSDKVLPPKQRSFTGIFQRELSNTGLERRPSLQNKIKEFVDSDSAKGHETESFEEEGEEDGVSRVSFAVVNYSSKRKLGEKDRNIIAGVRDIKISTIKEESESTFRDSNIGESSSPVNLTTEPLAAQEPKLSLKDVDPLSETPEKTPSKDDDKSPPQRRRSMTRPTSLLRKMSSEEMMNDPLLRPLAIELSGTNVDKQYFEEVFDRYQQTYDLNDPEEVIFPDQLQLF